MKSYAWIEQWLILIFFANNAISTAFQADLIGPDQKEYMIVKTQPSEQLCKGKEFMQDRDGKRYCVAKKADPENETSVRSLNYQKCGRVNQPLSSPQQATNRIMGGFNVTEHKYPWVVSLQVIQTGESELTHGCTGSILSKTAILTAAHCDYGLTLHIVFGTNDNRLTKGNIKAKKVIPHPDYVEGIYIPDAMIVILEEPIMFTKDVGPICLPSVEEVEVGQDVIMTGWGAVETFDNLLIKYNIVKPPLRREEEFEDMKIWRYEDMEDLTSYLDSFRNYLLVKFKSVVPDFNKMFDDDFKRLDMDRTKMEQSVVRFEEMIQQMNIESSNDRDILVENYQPFLEWLIQASDLLREGLDSSMEWSKVNGELQTPAPLKTLTIALLERSNLLSLQTEPFLKEAKAKTADVSICNKYKSSNSTENFCTFNVLGEDEGSTCMGDSGGPLAAMIDNQYVVLGITHAGQASIPIDCVCNCRDENDNYLPAVFQKTQTIMDWIKKTLKENDALPDK